VARHTRIRLPYGTRPSKNSGTTINQQRQNLRLKCKNKTIFLFYLILYYHADLLDREDGEEEYRPTEESEAEAMRLLELEPTDPDSGATAELAQGAGGSGTEGASSGASAGGAGGAERPPTAGGNNAASNNAASAAPQDPETGKKSYVSDNALVNRKKRDRSPTESEDMQSSRGSRRDSVSSFSSFSYRQKSSLPALYYSTQNKRDSAIKPRILGGGGGHSSC
jgi:hypothetical protein